MSFAEVPPTPSWSPGLAPEVRRVGAAPIPILHPHGASEPPPYTRPRPAPSPTNAKREGVRGRFMESLHSLLRTHWDHEPLRLTEARSGPRVCDPQPARFMGRTVQNLHLASLRLNSYHVRHRREGSRDSAGQRRANFFGQLDGQVHVSLAFRPMNEVLDLARFVSLLSRHGSVHFVERVGKRIRRKIVRQIHAFAQLLR